MGRAVDGFSGAHAGWGGSSTARLWTTSREWLAWKIRDPRKAVLSADVGCRPSADYPRRLFAICRHRLPRSRSMTRLTLLLLLIVAPSAARAQAEAPAGTQNVDAASSAKIEKF